MRQMRHTPGTRFTILFKHKERLEETRMKNSTRSNGAKRNPTAKQPNEQDSRQARTMSCTPGIRDDLDPLDPSNPPAIPPMPATPPTPPTLPTLTYDPELGPGYFVQTRSDFLRFPGFSPTA